ncbi:hypothetical protein F7725_022245 [Dissostichus mawsoni]|uniref:CARMIL pleckstrin homology domain-containing protein n=1 Tax=Dissostichus mawsoni TaxID=36200 RepID=A0A7J5YXJ1_DISMA|nr:hypothetical protein F7725_022245 [Dissostichus mawsoni]
MLNPHRVCLVTPVILHPPAQTCGRSASRFVVLSLWRGYLFNNKPPVRLETTFSYLEICSINIHSLTQVVLETDRQTLSFSVLHVEDLEAMDIDNIYYMNNWREFDLQDFSHLDSSSVFQPVVSKIYSKELKLLTFLLSRSPSLEELSLEASGLKMDFALKMAAALQEHRSSTLQSINLSGNPLEDKGAGCLSQVLSSTQLFSVSLTHLDLSANPGSMGTEEATVLFLFKFLSSTNSLSHLDLSDTSCPLDTLFVSLSAGCCFKLMHLNLARNPFSHRSIGQFFSQSCELKYVGLSATKLPPQALRLLLQGLATNILLLGLELDISSCELRSAGAQVIQEHISEVTAITSLDISDNGFESDMVTLVLSVGMSLSPAPRTGKKLCHEVQSLSVSDSKLKAGVHILLSALGGHAALTEVDISGNNIGDTGAKMLAKALLTNTTLRTLSWDRNNVTARGFQDVADALERNFTLQQVSGLADITQSYRGNPTEQKRPCTRCLDRNNQRQSVRVELQQVFKAQQSEMEVQGLCLQLEDSLQRLNPCSPQEVQAEVLTAQEVLHNARESFKVSWMQNGSSRSEEEVPEKKGRRMGRSPSVVDSNPHVSQVSKPLPVPVTLPPE